MKSPSRGFTTAEQFPGAFFENEAPLRRLIQAWMKNGEAGPNMAGPAPPLLRQGRRREPHLDPVMRPLNLSKDEGRALVAFLEAL
jgi:hypothetical protein